MSKIKLSAAQAKALRDAEIIGNMYVIKAHAATVKALRNLGMVERETFCLTVAGAVARTGLEGMNLSRGTSVYPYDLGDAEELFVIPSVSDVPSDVRADWEREQESNVIIDEPYWASNGPLLETLDSVPSECYWGCSNPVTHAFTDYVGRTEGVCGAHAHLPLSGKVVALPTDDMIEEEAQTAKPYVVEGRVWVKIPGLFHNGQPVEVDEGTERFIITPGYTTELDCARMTCMKRYGRRNPNVRVSDVTYVGPLNP